MKKKIAILFVMIGLSLISVVIGVYAWIIVPTAGVDLNMKSSELFQSRLIASIGSNEIDYNDAFYDDKQLAIKMTRAQIDSNRSGTTFPLKMDVNVKPNKNVRVRIKLVEIWTNNNNIIITRPNAFTFTYNTSTLSAANADGYRTYNSDVLKDTSVTIPFITSGTVTMSNIPNNTTVKLSVVVSVIQANRTSAWSQAIPSYTGTFAALTNVPVQVIYNGVSNQEFGRGIYIEMVGQNNSNRYNFVWHSRQAAVENITTASGQYKFYINLTNYMSFTVSYVSSKLTITITNSSPSNWGYEDVLYSPTTIANWSPSVSYAQNDLVYFDDPDEGENDQSGYYIAVSGSSNINKRPDQNSWAWRTMALDYQPNTMYTTGTILFHNSVFYKAKKDTWSSPPAADAWERMDRLHSTGNSYPTGSIVFTEDSNKNRTYYYAMGPISTYQAPADWTNWKQFGFNYTAINVGGKYEIGEVVYYNGHYWRVKVKGWIGAPSEGTNWSRISQPNPASYNPNADANYKVWDYVEYNSKFYYLRATKVGSNIPGTTGSTWQELTEEWVPTNIYRNPANHTVKQMVYYGGGMYLWEGNDNSNSLTAPGTERNGWTELTEVWRYYNNYKIGDRVIYNGSYWEAMQLPLDGNGEPIRPGTNFVVWKEYQIIWDPNRG